MEKKMNNKGFSLVELIIVVAIMAVLIGVLAPAYLQYVEKSKKTADCSAVGSVMDAIEIIAADPGIDWTSETINVDFDGTSGCSYTNGTTEALAQLERIVPHGDVNLTGNWDANQFDFGASKDDFGNVAFDAVATDLTDIEEISPKLESRYE
jgi:prepilin-type N-terminal cleavage/methylation domain-containing protein